MDPTGVHDRLIGTFCTTERVGRNVINKLTPRTFLKNNFRISTYRDPKCKNESERVSLKIAKYVTIAPAEVGNARDSTKNLFYITKPENTVLLILHLVTLLFVYQTILIMGLYGICSYVLDGLYFGCMIDVIVCYLLGDPLLSWYLSMFTLLQILHHFTLLSVLIVGISWHRNGFFNDQLA